MKKLILISFIFLSLVTVNSAFAQGKAPTPTKDLRQEFQTKLATIRDANKQAIVQRMDQRIAQVNANRTAIMLSHLNIIQDVLNKLKARSASLDVSAAQKAIDSARTLVLAQQAKTYTINITTETNLGQAVSATRISLASDLQKAHQSVVAARKATRTILVVLNKTAGEKLTTDVNDTK